MFCFILNQFEFLGPASRCAARGGAALAFASSSAVLLERCQQRCLLTSCLLRALLWPLPPAGLPPQPALPQRGAESESVPTAQGLPWGRIGLALWKSPVLVGQEGKDAHEVAEPRALGLHGASRVDGAPQVLAALRGGAHEAASPPLVAPPSSADLADASPPQEPQEREGVPWDEVPVSSSTVSARCTPRWLDGKGAAEPRAVHGGGTGTGCADRGQGCSE